MKNCKKSVRSIVFVLLLAIFINSPTVYGETYEELIEVSEEISISNEFDILDGVEEEYSVVVVEASEDVKEKELSENSSDDIHDLGKNIVYYGPSATFQKLKSDPLFEAYGDKSYEVEIYMDKEFSKKTSDKTLVLLKDFTEKYLPKKYGSVDIFFAPVSFFGVNGYYSSFSGSNHRNPGIVIAAPYSHAKDTLFHEFGHHIKYIYFDKGNKDFNKYKEIFNDKELRSNPYGSVWETLITESFAEDFATYIRYSFEGLSMKDANKYKRTIYPFTEEIVKFFDDLFPNIKIERLKRFEGLKEAEKIIRAENAISRATYSNWAKEDIYNFYYNGLEIDRDNYTKELTRDQFANMAVQIYELQNGKIKDYQYYTFDDTNEDYIMKAAKVGIIKGVGGNKFLPNKTIRREDMYLIIDRLSKLLTKEIEIDKSITNRSTTLEEGIAIINRFNN